MRKCQECGYENPDEALYCLKCGSKLEIVVEVQKPAAKAVEEVDDKYFKLFTGSMVMISVATILDLIMNSGIRTLVTANLLLAISAFVAAVGALLIIYAYFKGEMNDMRLYRIGSVLAGAGYLVIFLIPLIGGISLFYPVWIIYLFLFLYLRKYERSR